MFSMMKVLVWCVICFLLSSSTGTCAVPAGSEATCTNGAITLAAGSSCEVSCSGDKIPTADLQCNESGVIDQDVTHCEDEETPQNVCYGLPEFEWTDNAGGRAILGLMLILIPLFPLFFCGNKLNKKRETKEEMLEREERLGKDLKGDSALIRTIKYRQNRSDVRRDHQYLGAPLVTYLVRRIPLLGVFTADPVAELQFADHYCLFLCIYCFTIMWYFIGARGSTLLVYMTIPILNFILVSFAGCLIGAERTLANREDESKDKWCPYGSCPVKSMSCIQKSSDCWSCFMFKKCQKKHPLVTPMRSLCFLLGGFFLFVALMSKTILPEDMNPGESYNEVCVAIYFGWYSTIIWNSFLSAILIESFFWCYIWIRNNKCYKEKYAFDADKTPSYSRSEKLFVYCGCDPAFDDRTRATIKSTKQEIKEEKATELTTEIEVIAHSPHSPLEDSVDKAEKIDSPTTDKAETPIADKAETPIAKAETPIDNAGDAIGQNVISDTEQNLHELYDDEEDDDEKPPKPRNVPEKRTHEVSEESSEKIL